MGQQFTETLGAMKTAAPQELDLQKQFQGAFQGLDMNTLQSYLQGGDNAPGMLSLIGGALPQLDTMTNASADRLAAGDTARLGANAPALLGTMAAANPNQGPLLGQLNQSALTGLQAGDKMTPAQLEQFQQYMRGAQASRGMGFGPSDALQETMGEQNFGQQLLGQRQQFGTQVAGVNQNDSQSKMQWLLQWLKSGGNNVGQATNMASGGLNAQNQFATPMFNPQNSYAANIYDTQFNAQQASNIASANNKTAVTSALIGVGGKLLGGGMGML
jgi:hypothetical protein